MKAVTADELHKRRLRVRKILMNIYGPVRVACFMFVWGSLILHGLVVAYSMFILMTGFGNPARPFLNLRLPRFVGLDYP